MLVTSERETTKMYSRSNFFNMFLPALVSMTVLFSVASSSGQGGSEMLIYRSRKLAGNVELPTYRGRELGGEPVVAAPTTMLQNIVDPEPEKPMGTFLAYSLIGVAIVIILGFFLSMFLVSMRIVRLAKEREILKNLAESPLKRTPPPAAKDPDAGRTELVFFVDEHEQFRLDDLFEATADLRNQSMCSSLYKVVLKNNGVYAVKRLKKLQVSFEQFGWTMRRIGELKHPNILPLVGYSSASEEKLIIYKFQSNGSLLKMLEDHIEGRREFPWKLRLSIAGGIARGLDFIYQNPDDQEMIIPHGNLKLSNILVGDNDEARISEYGLSRFLDPESTCFMSANGYTAPERALSEQADVYSFGMILLELLTGKAVEKTGIDLPKWVKAMVREEWTGEVFDKEVSTSAREYAFPLLNIALKCVSFSPDDRPSAAEVMEKIQEVLVANANDDEDDDTSTSRDWSMLRSVIPETWDTPGSNY